MNNQVYEYLKQISNKLNSYNLQNSNFLFKIFAKIAKKFKLNKIKERYKNTEVYQTFLKSKNISYQILAVVRKNQSELSKIDPKSRKDKVGKIISHELLKNSTNPGLTEIATIILAAFLASIIVFPLTKILLTLTASILTAIICTILIISTTVYTKVFINLMKKHKGIKQALKELYNMLFSNTKDDLEDVALLKTVLKLVIFITIIFALFIIFYLHNTTGFFITVLIGSVVLLYLGSVSLIIQKEV